MTPALETFMDHLFGDEADSPEEAGRLLIERGRPTSLLGRPATAEEVATLIVHLSSPQASATTGTSGAGAVVISDVLIATGGSVG